MAKKNVPLKKSYSNGMDYAEVLNDRFEAKIHSRDKHLHAMKNKRKRN